MKNETIVYIGVAIIILIIAFSIGLITINSNMDDTSIQSTPMPTKSQVFYVTMSPPNQNVVTDLGQGFQFEVTITGNPTYPCALTLKGEGLSYDAPMRLYATSSSPSRPVHPGESSGSPLRSEGNSKTYVIAPIIYQSYTGRAVSYYVSVVDSLGVRYSSNSVTVTFK